MISSLSLTNFKSVESLEFRLSKLTILTGLNGSGKSSVLQALAVAKQSGASALRLRGPLVQLGNYSDVYSEGARSDGISILVTEDERVYSWSASGRATDSYIPLAEKLHSLPSFFLKDGFQFLPADRLVPKNAFPRSSTGESDLGFLGPRGEYVIDYLLSSTLEMPKERITVRRNRLCPKEGLGLSTDLVTKVAPTPVLMDQVSGWLQQLSPGVRVSVEELLGTDDVSLRFGYVGREGFYESDRHIRPSNVGFGLTYSLPIVVACLAARPGALLLLENPEAHLHPQGQAALGELIVRTAEDGVQVIVETHSDHVLNGVRLAVKRKHISPEDVTIHFMTRALSSGHSYVESPAMLPDGRLSDWPQGFFDQWDLAIDELVR